MKKNPLSLQLDLEDFLPATDAEKEYMVQMRPSTTFFKDGMKRLLRNKVATVSMILNLVSRWACHHIPFFWPYSSDTMWASAPATVAAFFNNSSPLKYGKTELQRIEAGGEGVPPRLWHIAAGRTTLSVWFTAPGSPWPLASSPA